MPAIAIDLQAQAFNAQLLAMNALFEAALVGESARQSAMFIAFGQDASSEFARLQWQEMLDALCDQRAANGADTRAGLLLDDLDHCSQALRSLADH